MPYCPCILCCTNEGSWISTNVDNLDVGYTRVQLKEFFTLRHKVKGKTKDSLKIMRKESPEPQGTGDPVKFN